MNARLRRTVETAETCLPEEGQEELACLMELFMANFRRDPAQDFSQVEWEELRRTAAEPFSEADPAEVEAFYTRNGV